MDGFGIGLVIGLLGMIVAQFCWNLIQGWINTRDKFYKPQTVVHFTDKTPAEIYSQSKAAGFLLSIVKLFALLAGIGFFTVYFPGNAMTIFEHLIDILEIVIQIFMVILQLCYTIISGL